MGFRSRIDQSKKVCCSFTFGVAPSHFNIGVAPPHFIIGVAPSQGDKLLVVYTVRGDNACPVYMTGRYCLFCIQDREILLVLFTGQGDIACPIYSTWRYCLSCIHDREILLVLY